MIKMLIGQTIFGMSVVSVVIAGSVAAMATPAAAPGLDFTPDPIYEGIMCDSDIECEEATGYPYEVAMSPNPPKYPRLVGIGCEGTNGAPIYAFEEDHLPKCREIWAMDWDWQERIVK